MKKLDPPAFDNTLRISSCLSLVFVGLPFAYYNSIIALVVSASVPTFNLGRDHHHQGRVGRDENGGSRGQHSSITSVTGTLPKHSKSKLHTLFKELEREFEMLHLENARLRDKIRAMEKGTKKCWIPSSLQLLIA